MSVHESELPILKTDDENSKVIQEFLEDCELRNLSPETIRAYKGDLRIFNRFLLQNQISPADLGKDDLRNFLRYLKEERKISQKTIDNYFSALSSFYKYLVYENVVDRNIVLPFRERYLNQYGKSDSQNRQLISVEEMATMINAEMNIRNKAIIATLAKTGVRRGGLILMDLDDVDWVKQSIELANTRKRTNRTVFFDDETGRIMKKWVRERNNWETEDGCEALFIGEHGDRLQRHGVYHAVIKAAERVELHDPGTEKMGDHFTPHCCRHWFTTHLRRSGMLREYIKELRGDSRNEAMDIYHHIDREELRESYLTHVPQLGI